MAQLTNTPRQEIALALEARKSFALGLWFRTADKAAVDITGDVITLVIAQKPHRGGAAVVTEAAVLAEPLEGYARLDLQAADLDIAAGLYDYSITLVDDNYSGVVVKGELEILANTSSVGLGDAYVIETPPLNLGVELRERNHIHVVIDHVKAPELSVLVETVAPGNPATAVLTGTYPHQILTLGIPQGTPGVDGVDGVDGQDGIDGINGVDGQDGVDGIDGLSAYSIAVANGFVGLQPDWLASLEGAPGADGQDASDEVAAAWVTDEESETHAAVVDLAKKHSRRLIRSSRGRDPARFTVATDFTGVGFNVAGDASLTEQYVIGAGDNPPNPVNTFPPDWPVDLGHGSTAVSANFAYQFAPQNAGMRRWRFYTDAPKVAWYGNTPAGGHARAHRIWVDGRPTVANAGTHVAAADGSAFHFISFATAGVVRLVEIETVMSVQAWYVAKPYRMWKPEPVSTPIGLVVGDSYVAAYIQANGLTHTINGMYQGMAHEIGVDILLTNGVGSTGYLAKGPTGALQNYRERVAANVAFNPDFVVYHGGGANDLYYQTSGVLPGGVNVGLIAAQIVATLQETRDALPDAKLIFVEGFAPPVGFSTFNDEYIQIRQIVQEDAADIGVYYVDVATTKPWLDGTGYFGAVANNGNSDVFVGPDGVHLTTMGNKVLGQRMAQKLRRILADDGTLLNQLV